MNGYLVQLCHTMDDFPVYFSPHLMAAQDFAANLDEGRLSRKMGKLFGIDATTPVCVKIVTFEKGKPVKVELVRDLE